MYDLSLLSHGNANNLIKHKKCMRGVNVGFYTLFESSLNDSMYTKRVKRSRLASSSQ